MISRRRIAAFAAAIVTASLVLVGVPAPAHASGPVSWSASVDDVNPYELITGVDGSVTPAGCSSTNGSKGTETFSASGSPLGSTPVVTVGSYQFPALSLCDFQKAVGTDGALYGVDATSYPVQKLAAYSPAGIHQWSSRIDTTDCPNMQGTIRPDWVRVGEDGNVYAGGQSQYDWCGNPWYVISYTPSGALRWQVRVNPIDLLAPYNGGLVVGSASHRELQYIGYDGTLNATISITESAPAGLGVSGAGVTAGGTVILAVYNWMDPGQCGVNWTGTSAVVAYGASGEVYSHAEPPCLYDVGLTSLADGGVAYVQDATDRTASVIVLGSSGSAVRQIALPTSENGRQFVTGAFSLTGDTNGGLLVARNYSYQYQGSTRKGTSFVLYAPNSGVAQGAFYTDAIDPSLTQSMQDLGASPGKLYFVARHCASETCSTLDPTALYSVPMAKLGMDYPRGAVLGVQAVVFDKMAVGGDSYSAGVGSLLSGQAYDPGTEADQCYRSPSAYAHQLAEDPSVKLQLPSNGFVACSGATTDAITNSYNTEPAQAAVIPADAKSIFITLGGNDAKFGRLGALCIFADCSTQQYQDEFAAYLASLQTKLETAYTALLDHATGATLYVIGYPHILPLQDCTDGGSGGWWFALGSERLINPQVYIAQAEAAGLTHDEAQAAWWSAPTISNAEALYANTFEDQLNLKIGNAVDTVAASYPGRIVFVDTALSGGPMDGHQLCSSDPYFNGLDGNHQENTFHPNAGGQNGLMLVAGAALATHQPQYVLAA